MAQQVKNPPVMQEIQERCVQSLDWKDPLRRAWQPTPLFLLGEYHGQRRLVATVHGIANSQTWLKWLSMHTRTYNHILMFSSQTIQSLIFFGKHMGITPSCDIIGWILWDRQLLWCKVLFSLLSGTICP